MLFRSLLAEAPFLDQQTKRKTRIGENLVKLNLITESNLEEALNEQLQTGEKLGQILANRGFINQNSVDQLIEKNRQVTQKNNHDYTLGNTVAFLVECMMSLEEDEN